MRGAVQKRRPKESNPVENSDDFSEMCVKKFFDGFYPDQVV